MCESYKDVTEKKLLKELRVIRCFLLLQKNMMAWSFLCLLIFSFCNSIDQRCGILFNLSQKKLINSIFEVCSHVLKDWICVLLHRIFYIRDNFHKITLSFLWLIISPELLLFLLLLICIPFTFFWNSLLIFLTSF